MVECCPGCWAAGQIYDSHGPSASAIASARIPKRPMQHSDEEEEWHQLPTTPSCSLL
jgi:hypothetical protein